MKLAEGTSNKVRKAGEKMKKYAATKDKKIVSTNSKQVVPDINE